MKKTKYMKKGGTLKRKGGGMTGMKKTKYMAKGGPMKKTKYMSKGGAIKRKNGGKVTLSGMTARRNAMRGK